MKVTISIVLLVILLPRLGYGGEKYQHEVSEDTSGVDSLSAGLRELLSQEMQALQEGMMSIVPAYVSGNWTGIATIAEKLKSSYLLKQNLTQRQAKELHSMLPASFVEEDQRFHKLAGMLEQAATAGNAELIGFYFYKMGESCVSCHTVHAAHRFPILLSKEMEEQHPHEH